MSQRLVRQTQVFHVILHKAELNRDLINLARVYVQLHFSVAATEKTSTTGWSVFMHFSEALHF